MKTIYLLTRNYCCYYYSSSNDVRHRAKHEARDEAKARKSLYNSYKHNMLASRHHSHLCIQRPYVVLMSIPLLANTGMGNDRHGAPGQGTGRQRVCGLIPAQDSRRSPGRGVAVCGHPDTQTDGGAQLSSSSSYCSSSSIFFCRDMSVALGNICMAS